MRETTATIAEWADETFGKPKTNMRIAVRALDEMRELIQKLDEDDNHPGAAEECYDINIVLSRLVRNLGGDMDSGVQDKMKENRARRWQVDGTGCGQHVD